MLPELIGRLRNPVATPSRRGPLPNDDASDPLRARPRRTAYRPAGRVFSAKFSAKSRSFSAVSAPIFASKYAFCSILQNLPDDLAEFFEIWQYFANFTTLNFAKILLNFRKIADFSNRIDFFC